ncbi:MAG TPA: ATP-grasp domain-containing protein [Synergistales bacterium]|jgi:hypothetical protein|nr:ATP-grasp domain-containing protein [Synergistales bacterium]HRV71042.1 ATP-grasp domain-containing protein [Thermovirgaceae bacterium]
MRPRFTRPSRSSTKIDRNLLIVAFSTRGLADLACGSGFRNITAVDAFGDRDHPSSVENISTRRHFGLPFTDEAILKACEGRARGGIFVYGGGMENRPGLVEAIARGRLIAGNSVHVLGKARDPSILGSLCREESIPFPEVLGPGEEGRAADEPDRSANEARWLRKRVLSGGGSGVSEYRGGRIESGEILQRRIPGRPVSVSFIAHRDGALITGFSEQLTGTSFLGGKGYRWCGNITPLPARQEDATRFYEKASYYAEIISDRLGLRGFSGIDMILGPDGSVAVIEVNPRYSGSMELFRPAGDKGELFSLHLAACRGERLRGKRPVFCGEGPFRAKGIVYAVRDCAAPDTLAWSEAGRRDVPWTGDVFSPGDPVCTVFSSAPEGEECIGRLAEEAGKVYSELVALCEGGNRENG